MEKMLLIMIGNWEKCGNDSSARSKDAPDYVDGKDNIELVDRAMKIAFAPP